jgi:hypothetical protein
MALELPIQCHSQECGMPKPHIALNRFWRSTDLTMKKYIS